MSDTSIVPDLELCLARDPSLVRAAQELRYRVFYEEMGARANPATLAAARDADAFDDVADHLVVVDRSRADAARPFVVGCYRLLRGPVAAAHGGFYSASEFDLTILDDRLGEIVELGRSCVHADYRNGTVMQLLWRGIAQYLERHDLKVMLGCASLPGTDLTQWAPSLAFLAAEHLAPAALRPRPQPERHVALPSPDGFTAIELKRGKAQLPPLLKAYLRMGGLIGDGAVVDEQFNTIDVCLVLPTDRLKDRYLRHLATAKPVDAVAA
jgi:putative hemolysin